MGNDGNRALPVITKIVSGGQTGVDRAALDWAIQHGIPHGGWCPHGRIAEDGVLPPRYMLQETVSKGYRQRTRRNVEDSDATLILNTGELDGGTLATLHIAKRLGRPCLVVQLDVEPLGNAIAKVADWLGNYPGAVLNIAGPRESKRPGIYRQAVAFLATIAKSDDGERDCDGKV